MNSIRVACAVLICFVSLSAQAQINKCTGPDGKVSYQQGPCSTSAKAENLKAGMNWTEAVEGVRDYAPAGLAILGIKSEGGNIVVIAETDDWQKVYEFEKALKKSNKYEDVETVDKKFTREFKRVTVTLKMRPATK